MADDKPLLGLATTRELLQELEARFRVSDYPDTSATMEDVLASLPKDMLEYRTVDPH